MGLGADIRVSQFILNGGWHFPSPKSNALMDIFQHIPNEIQPWSTFDDEVWTLEEKGFFSLKSAYKFICNIPNQ